MRHVSTLALCQLLAQVVDELDKRGRAEYGTDGLVNGWDPIETAWGDLEIDPDKEGWRFVWHSDTGLFDALGDPLEQTIRPPRLGRVRRTPTGGR